MFGFCDCRWRAGRSYGFSNEIKIVLTHEYDKGIRVYKLWWREIDKLFCSNQKELRERCSDYQDYQCWKEKDGITVEAFAISKRDYKKLIVYKVWSRYFLFIL